MSCCHAAAARAQEAEPSVGAQVVAAVLAVNSMTVALATNLNPLTDEQRLWAHMLLLALTLGNMALLGRPLATAVWRAGPRSVAGLFVLGLMGALGFSVMSTARGTGPVYYEVVSILLVIYSVGRGLTRLAQRRVVQELSKLTLQGTQVAVRRGQGAFVQMPVEAIEPGDAMMLRPGSVVAVDGVVEQGTAFMQTASLSGESQLRRVSVGDTVQASWFCADASLLIRASRSGTDRAIDNVADAVVAASARKAYPPSPAERVAAVFAPVVMAVAVITFAAWAAVGPWDVALLNALAVCLVACPCAFGFAAPIGLRTGSLRLAASGVVVREVRALESLAKITAVVFDKTGTLTRTALDATQTVVCAPSPWSSEQMLGLAASAQALVHHPISDAFAPWILQAPAGYQPVAAKLLPGVGIQVTCAGPTGEHILHLGDPAHLPEAMAHGPTAAAAARMQALGHKPVALIFDGNPLAIFALKDSPFVPPQELAEALRKRGISTQVLSGDGAAQVRALGIADAQGAMTPVHKLHHVEALQKHGSVCFVGDGINDSAAMGASDVAISMQSGADLSLELADLVLPASRPETLLVAIDVARSTARLIRHNFIISLGYNTVGMAVAAAGLLGPIAAALLMAASSLTVSARSLLLLKPPKAPPSNPSHGNRWAEQSMGRASPAEASS